MKKAVSIIMILGFAIIFNGFRVKGSEKEAPVTLTATETEKESIKKEKFITSLYLYLIAR